MTMLLSLCCSISQMTLKRAFLFFLDNNHTCNFSCLYCWTIEIWLITFLATGKSGELFGGTYFFKAERLFIFSYWCLFLIDSISEYNKHFFFPYCRLTTGMLCFWIHHSRSLLSIAVESASIIWNVTPIASRCWDVSFQCLNIYTRTSQSCLKWQSLK